MDLFFGDNPPEKTKVKTLAREQNERKLLPEHVCAGTGTCQNRASGGPLDVRYDLDCTVLSRSRRRWARNVQPINNFLLRA